MPRLTMDYVPVTPGFVFALPFGCAGPGRGMCDGPGREGVDLAKARVILSDVAADSGFDVADIVGPCRQRPLVVARHRAMAWMRAETGLSFARIGALLGGRDVATVIAGVRKYQQVWSRS